MNLRLSFSMLPIILFGVLLSACSEDDPLEINNEPPVVANPLADQNYEEGFETATIPLMSVFSDPEGANLSYLATSSDNSVVEVAVTGTSLLITEQGAGSATITITAEDPDGATVQDQFLVSVNAAGNELPVVVNPLSDITLSEGFMEESIALVSVFMDAETMMLQFSAESSDLNVVSVATNMGELIITEVGVGMSTITVTAMDEAGGAVSDMFEVTVSEAATCSNDNSISSDLGTCDEQPSVENSYSESISGSTRTVTTNGIPNHTFSNQLRDVDELNSETKTYRVSSEPSKASNTSSILTAENRPRRRFGVALNGVVLDPAPAEPFIFTITGGANDGEFNWDWVFEPTNNTGEVGLDCATAHVQPDGTYHYHGDMVEYANTLMSGLGDGTVTPAAPVQLGWAADGFPILYKYGPDANGNVALLQSSYQLQAGLRPGDGGEEPCGEYNGKYTNDYVYSSGSGDLDECNGVDRSITLGGETFNYFYVITDAFPVIPRCLVGTPDDSFNLGGG